MKTFFLSFFISITFVSSYSQEIIPKKANVICIKGVAFADILSGLLDAGYIINRLDTNLKVVSTEFKVGENKTKYLASRLHIRIKDTVAYFSGDWYNTVLDGSNLLGMNLNSNNLTEKIQYASVNPKLCFLEMKKFAERFNKKIEYLVN